MTPGRRNLLLVLLVALALGLFAALSWVLSTPPDTGSAPSFVDTSPRPAPVEHTGEAGVRETATAMEIEQEPEQDPAATTVVFPLKVELELLRAEATLQAEGQPARGSDATARLKGQIADSTGAPVRATIEVLAGPNRGRIFTCDARGQFGVNDLYPGRVLLDVTGPNILGSQREVILRKDRETLFNLGYGRPASVVAEVVDAEGKPIENANVTMDGQRTLTGPDGVFSYPYIASGEVTVFVEKTGYASVFQLLTITAGSHIEKGRLKFRLDRGASLRLSIAENINAGQPATIFVLPASLAAQRTYPWARLNPITSLHPGGTITIDDLPTTPLVVRVFHSGAIAKPAQQSVVLDPGQPTLVELHLEPAPIVFGVVTIDGQPAGDAEVTLEVGDRVNATLGALGETNYLMLESEVMPDAPTAVQYARTNAAGEYQLTANEHVSKFRYLVARSKDGRHQAGLVLQGGETKVDIALTAAQPVGDGPCEFILQTSPRYQALPIELLVNNTPREVKALLPDRDLHVTGLVKGRWRVRAKWEDITLLPDRVFDLDSEVTLSVKLPDGAILGQDDETRKRARRP